MNIRSLEVFIALSEELHFRRAAERLGMSQSLVSDHLRKLEADLGCTLLDRNSRRVALTENGEEFRRKIQIPLAQIKKSIIEMRFSAKKESIRLGFMGGGFYGLHQLFVNKFNEKYPGVSLEFVELHYDNQFTSILSGAVDVSLCRLPIGMPGLQAGQVLMRDSRVICLNANHPLADRELIDFEELAGETMLQAPVGVSGKEWVDFHFPLLTPSGQQLFPGRTIKTVREGLSAVASDFGIFFMTKRASDYYSNPNIKYVDINLPLVGSALVWAENNYNERIEKINNIVSEFFD
ncbi:LysR family transcriptional regulator [Lampropedia aestuarii]|uniref:LysR family transcriptional regulator n=1 Tax=Lampropedia aestuarii TaxID=2562762 RepID=A0A4S5BMD0_9BURK|nr:LysR family transcriptional regulator [Lampropedia aestuarii]THJ30666.1 LysR family transcriptional regulator [Lampropedia aestuarii]